MTLRLAAIDYGLERIGLAVCDPEGTMAFPLRTVRLSDFGSRKAQLDAIAAMITAESAGGVVLGLPLMRDGAESETTRQVRNFCSRLKRRLDLPFFYMPEFLSSEEAWSDLVEAGASRRKRRAVLDQQAAVRILSSFLNLEPHQRRRA